MVDINESLCKHVMNKVEGQDVVPLIELGIQKIGTFHL